MKFIRYSIKDVEKIGVLSLDDKKVIELNEFELPFKIYSMVQAIENLKDVDILKITHKVNDALFVEHYGVDIEKIVLCSPIKHPIHDIICVGVNYKKHLEESISHIDVESMETVYFSKRSCEILGTNNKINVNFDLDKAIDYEVELAVIIGKTGKNISLDESEKYIFGYSVFNDLSARTLQKNHNQWFRGKSLDNFSIMGPAIIHKSSVNNPNNLDIKSYVNGEIRQNSNTSLLLKDISTLISELSREMTLEAGDIIITGTPEGVGMGFSPPRYLKKGDIVECIIEDIGEIRNIIC